MTRGWAWPTLLLLLAAACVTGWSGPGILTRLGGVIERRLGLAPLHGAGRGGYL